MKYHDLKRHLERLTVFTLQDIFLWDSGFRQATLYDWEKLHRVVRLKNGRYVFSDFVPANLDYYLLANLICEPSYVSTEMALNHYGVIPEVLTSTTSVTTAKTQTITTPFGDFVYQSIQPELFFGYELLEVRNRRVQIASLEKSILDYLYFNSKVVDNEDFLSLRWNKVVLNEEINQQTMEKYLAVFANVALSKRVASLYKYLGT